MKQSRIRSTSPITDLAAPARVLSTRELASARGGTFGGGISRENFIPNTVVIIGPRTDDGGPK